MKFSIECAVHFNGTTMSIEVFSISDAATGEVFLSNRDAGAKVILHFRDRGIYAYDSLRQQLVEPEPEAPAEPAVEPPAPPVDEVTL